MSKCQQVKAVGGSVLFEYMPATSSSVLMIAAAMAAYNQDLAVASSASRYKN